MSRKQKIRVTTTCFEVPDNLSKRYPLTIKRNLILAERYLKKAGELKSDIVLLPECFAVKGMKETFDLHGNVAEKVPNGKTSEFVSKFAKEYRMHVIAPIMENDRGKIHNTALIFDRKGNIIGKYRKAHLPEEEKISTIPGDRLPIFKLDFGIIAICICYDLNFPEVSRILSLKGADILFWPTMWSRPKHYVVTYMKGQAASNSIYFVSSNYAQPGKGVHIGQSAIIDPEGTVLANTGNRGGIASAVIDLNTKKLSERKKLSKDRKPKLYKYLTR